MAGKKILIILNHQPSEEQIQELQRLGYTEYEIVKPGELDPTWDGTQIYDYFMNLVKGRTYDGIWCQTDYRIFGMAVLHCLAKLKPLLVATSRREVVETKNPDGSITKVSTFRHVRFVHIV